MLDTLKFHHIGVAVKDLDAAASIYEQGGYDRSASIFASIQNVNICWLTKFEMPTIELLAFCGSRVCFLFNKNMGLIELVEASANIIE